MSAPAKCSHCGLPVINPDSGNGKAEVFCCAGCELLYLTLNRLGLQEFYEYRNFGRWGSLRPAASGNETYARFDTSDFTDRNSRILPSGIHEARLFLEGVHCAGCVWLIEKLPRFHKGVIASSLNMLTGVVRISFDPEVTSLSEVARTLASLGYLCHEPHAEEAEQASLRSRRQALSRLAVAGFCAMNVMVIAVSLHQGSATGIEPQIESFLRWVSLVLTIPVISYSAIPFYRRTFEALKRKTLHIDVPIAAALSACFLSGVWNTLAGNGPVFFDSLNLVVFLLLSGRYAQQWALDRARRQTSLSVALLPSVARSVDNENSVEIPVEHLHSNMLLEVRAGERFPADGTVMSGLSSVDTSLLTGEPLPVPVESGSVVYAGTLNIESTIRMMTTGPRENFRMARILQLLSEQTEKSEILAFTDRAAHYFVAGTLFLAVVTLVLWLPAGVEAALANTVALLLVTCPCALGLASPAAFAAAIARASQAGILIRNTDAIEKLARVRTVYLDKTGTITSSKPIVKRCLVRSTRFTERSIAPYIHAIASLTPRHPVSGALIQWSSSFPLTIPSLKSHRHFPGLGIEAIDESDVEWRLGSA